MRLDGPEHYRRVVLSNNGRRRDGGGLWPYKGCLMSVSCLDFSVLALTSYRISGGAIPASLYSEGSGVCRRDPVTTRQALLSSGSIFLAWHDFSHTAAQYSAVPGLLSAGLTGLFPSWSWQV